MPSKITLSDLIPTIKEVVNGGNEATFIPHGVSMRPMLYGGRDEIILVKPSFPLNKYDLPLYLRKNGTVVLHRIVKVRDTHNGREYFMRGDNTWALEQGITEADMIAVVSRFKRNGKWYRTDSVGYRFYVRLWCFSYPIRSFFHRGFNFVFRVLRRLYRIIKRK